MKTAKRTLIIKCAESDLSLGLTLIQVSTVKNTVSTQDFFEKSKLQFRRLRCLRRLRRLLLVGSFSTSIQNDPENRLCPLHSIPR